MLTNAKVPVDIQKDIKMAPSPQRTSVDQTFGFRFEPFFFNGLVLGKGEMSFLVVFVARKQPNMCVLNAISADQHQKFRRGNEAAHMRRKHLKLHSVTPPTHLVKIQNIPKQSPK